MSTALDWWTFAQDAPELARSGWHLLNGAARMADRGGQDDEHGCASVLLATPRNDGGVRLRPCRPLLDDGRLYLRLEDGTAAARDLRRDGRFGIRARDGSEFRIEGTAVLQQDPVLRARITARADPEGVDADVLFELLLEQAGLTRPALVQPGRTGAAPEMTTIRRRASNTAAGQIRWRCLGRRACA
ncbi:MAG TPA: hypothetical protein VLA56_08810 [Pseudomonadales bacterium]|nr:hypothetical protein [Pseudomonadales bacterium]